MSWVIDEEAKRKLEKKRDSLREKLSEYEDDFAILVDQEMVIAKIYTICKDTNYLTVCLDGTIDQMTQLADTVRITGFNEVFDFTDLKSDNTMIAGLIEDNDAYSDYINNIGKKIDELKAEVASNINKTNNQISNVIDEIQSILDHPVWVED